MENTFKFKIGDTVSFERNQVIKSEGTVILALVDDKVPEEVKKKMSRPNSYIIENENGWKPSNFRASKYNLDTDKKYLFVEEDELNLI